MPRPSGRATVKQRPRDLRRTSFTHLLNAAKFCLLDRLPDHFASTAAASPDASTQPAAASIFFVTDVHFFIIFWLRRRELAVQMRREASQRGPGLVAAS